MSLEMLKEETRAKEEENSVRFENIMLMLQRQDQVKEEEKEGGGARETMAITKSDRKIV